MYKLLLVDDESEIRVGLTEVIPFRELGFEVVGEAANGLEALQLCEALSPDLIITDIRMPLMDGLTLCKKVRASYPVTQFIILTGFDDYEYVKQAIEVKTMGYLLKPISASEFREALQDAKVKLDEEFAQRRDISRLREHFRTSLPLLRETLFSALLSGAVAPGQALERARRYDAPLEAAQYAVALMRMGEAAEPGDIEEPELMTFSVLNIFAEVVDEKLRARFFHHNGLLAAILLLDDQRPGALDGVVALLEEARQMAVYYLKCRLYIGVGTAVKHLSQLPGAARQALSALDQCVINQEEHVLCITDLDPGRNEDMVADEYRLRQMANAVKTGDAGEAQTALERLMDACRLQMPSPKAYQAYLMEILVVFVRLVPEMALERANFNTVFDRVTQAIFLGCPTIDEAQAMLISLLNSLTEAGALSRRSTSLLLAAQAQDYLREHYADEDMTLEKLCQHLHISPSYFSMIFKKETKRTFHQYLTELRMERALTLLGTTAYKTAQIAAQVGLPDPSYFSYCFKKHFGFPPSKARRQKEA